jgi:hypothetical protein
MCSHKLQSCKKHLEVVVVVVVQEMSDSIMVPNDT